MQSTPAPAGDADAAQLFPAPLPRRQACRSGHHQLTRPPALLTPGSSSMQRGPVVRQHTHSRAGCTHHGRGLGCHLHLKAGLPPPGPGLLTCQEDKDLADVHVGGLGGGTVEREEAAAGWQPPRAQALDGLSQPLPQLLPPGAQLVLAAVHHRGVAQPATATATAAAAMQ